MRRGNINNKSDKKDILQVVDTIDTVDKSETIENHKEHNKDRIKIIILIVIIVLAILITAGLLIYKYVKINQQILNNNTGLTNNVVESKKETEDKKYLVTFKDMYKFNPLKITSKEYVKEATKNQAAVRVEYVEIEGLKDKELEQRINKEIKDNAFYYIDKVKLKQDYMSYTVVRGNFSNILSVDTDIYVYENDEMVLYETLTLNYNLVTGQQIKFLDLFASNTPMNSIIYDIEYKRLAWDTQINFEMSEEEIDKATNMDKRDTSEYEDIILKVINKYKNLDKDKIKFSVTPNAIHVALPIGEDGKEITYTIELYKYIDYVTMYKKFLTDKVIYEREALDELLVFNDMIGYTPEYYKFESDNLFVSIFSFWDNEYEKEQEKEEVEKYSQSVVNKKKQLMKKHIDKIISEVKDIAKDNKNKGYMARFMPYYYIDEYSNEYGGENLIYVSLDGSFEEMDIDYYNKNALKLLAKQNAAPKVSIDDFFSGSLASYDNKNIKSLLYNEDEEDALELRAYYTLDGKLVAKSYEEVEKYIDSKYKKPEPKPESKPEPEPELPEINIYKEN